MESGYCAGPTVGVAVGVDAAGGLRARVQHAVHERISLNVLILLLNERG